MNGPQALVVDDHPIVRDGIKQLLRGAFPSIQIREFSGAHGVLKEICSYPWTFITLDINLPGQIGLQIIKKIQTCCPYLPVIVFSMFPENQYGPRALRAGAAAYVSKERSALELVDTVKAVLRGEHKRSGLTQHSIALSKRENEVLNLTAKGMDRRQIAQALKINEKTISTYKSRLLFKLNARTTVDLIRFAIDEGLISGEPCEDKVSFT
jgi:two-component system invasion response regulator UvrY